MKAMTGLEPFGALAAKEVIGNITDDIYDTLKEKCSGTLKKWKREQVINELYRHVESVRKVKTLWQVDKPVDISEFYCFPHVVLPNNKRRKIACVGDVTASSNILIQGIAGQGKSILLRYLCAIEMQKGRQLPVFIELRKVSEKTTTFDLIYEWFAILGLELDERAINELGKLDKLAFFLDGFDEVKDDLKSRTIQEIEYLSQVTKPSKVIVSSRHDSGIEVSSFFDVVQLDNLRAEEYQVVINQLSNSPEDAELLINQIEAKGREIQELLITPLLVTLLLITYKSFQEIPDELTDFYDALFQVLLKRHDGTKPGYKRERYCAINDKQHRDLFDSFCFESKKTGHASFDYTEVYTLAEKTFKKVHLELDPTTFLEDIVKVTCLLVRDGEEYRYIHKSVQEFFAASYVSKRPEEIIKRFYTALLDKDIFQNWDQELRFLQEIDTFRYAKYFRIPLLRKILGLSREEKLRKPRATLVKAAEYFGGVNLALISVSGKTRLSPSVIGPRSLPFQFMPFRRLMEIDYSVIEKRESEKIATSEKKHKGKSNRAYKIAEISILAELKNGNFRSEFLSMTNDVMKDCFDEAKQLERWIMDEMENKLDLNDLEI